MRETVSKEQREREKESERGTTRVIKRMREKE